MNHHTFLDSQNQALQPNLINERSSESVKDLNNTSRKKIEKSMKKNYQTLPSFGKLTNSISDFCNRSQRSQWSQDNMSNYIYSNSMICSGCKKNFHLTEDEYGHTYNTLDFPSKETIEEVDIKLEKMQKSMQEMMVVELK